MPEPPNPRVEDTERAAALHWQAPETEPLGEWRLRAAAGFTGRANSALPVGDPGLPLAEAVTAVEEWYRHRDLRPTIVLPQGAAPEPLESLLAERSWVPRPGPAFVMTAEVADIPASTIAARFAAEPDEAFLGRILLQVETSNAPARALYARCGFRDSHRYHYMIAP